MAHRVACEIETSKCPCKSTFWKSRRTARSLVKNATREPTLHFTIPRFGSCVRNAARLSESGRQRRSVSQILRPSSLKLKQNPTRTLAFAGYQFSRTPVAHSDQQLALDSFAAGELMALNAQFVELTSLSLIACKECHTVADMTVQGSPVRLVCPGCRKTLGQWGTMSGSIADITAFIAANKARLCLVRPVPPTVV
jgi:hypothetical protein